MIDAGVSDTVAFFFRVGNVGSQRAALRVYTMFELAG